MKQLIITAVLIVLGVYLANTFILGGTDSMKSEGKRIGELIVEELGEIKGN